MIDTVGIAHKLQATGLTQKQSEVIAQSMLEIPDWANLVTKSDLNVVRAEIKTEILRAKYDLIYWVIGAFVISTIIQVGNVWLHKP